MAVKVVVVRDPVWADPSASAFATLEHFSCSTMEKNNFPNIDSARNHDTWPETVGGSSQIWLLPPLWPLLLQLRCLLHANTCKRRDLPSKDR